ncbi:sugar phosphate isomerase/epimerase family protein [Herpetosiphon llansteffanensis]|uniref:sugar phosphate isomerase/epimerase family protein n=1 Tax=Herpetosiphon llansteffanensis TaxID=2094568 RepID=UPI000D7CECED|nr:TIM barrel protein [Herpetosiphon llansteffanensis]
MSLLIGLNGRFFEQNWRPALAEIAFAAANGFASMQFQGKPAGLQAAALGANFASIRQQLQAKQIMAVMEINLQIDAAGCIATGQTPLEVLEANLPAINGLGCEYVHWHLNNQPVLEYAQVAELEIALQAQFAAGVALAQQHGFKFGFEHNDPILRLFTTPQACRQLLDAVPGLGFVWDFNHTLPEDLAGFVALIPRMSMLHISDTPLPEVNCHLPLGMGTIDFAAYCQALAAANFYGPAILEIGGLPKSGGYGRDTDVALIDSLQRLQAALA